MATNLFGKNHGEYPCRNPARIPHMVNLLHAAWAQEENVDCRMGEMLIMAARLGGWDSDNIYNCEDEIFARGFLKMIELSGKVQEADS